MEVLAKISDIRETVQDVTVRLRRSPNLCPGMNIDELIGSLY